MANPTTSYESGFPDIVYPGNTREERSLQENVLLQRARDYNIHDEEIKALQAYVGTAPTEGWTIGDDTLTDRVTQVGGTGGCWEGGTICNYTGPEGLDPAATGYVQVTGNLMGPGLIGGTGSLFGNPSSNPSSGGWVGGNNLAPIPPFGPQPAPWPWPNPWPQGPNPPQGGPVPAPYPGSPGAPNDDFNPPPGIGDQPADSDTWPAEHYLSFLNFSVQNILYLLNAKTSENTLIQPLQYNDVLPLFKDVAAFLDDWPRTRTNSKDLDPPRLTEFEVIAAQSGLIKQMSDMLGIVWVDGTISADGTKISFNSGSDTVNLGSTSTKNTLFYILANSSDSAFDNSNITEVVTWPGLVDAGEGLGVAGSYAVGGLSIPETYRPGGATEADVKIGFYAGRPCLSMQGDSSTWVVENLAVAGDTTTASFQSIESEINGAGVEMVVVLAGGIGAGTHLQDSGGAAPASGQFQVVGTTINFNAADAITSVQRMALAAKTLTN